MPELPDIVVYLAALEGRILGETLEGVRVTSPFVLRTVDPPIEDCHGRRVTQLRRLGKRVAVGLDGDLWLVIHLMIAGRLRWGPRDSKPPGKHGLAAFDFSSGSLVLIEAGAKRRASLHVVRGARHLAAHEPGGIDVLSASLAEFAASLQRENHTVKRALCDPRLFSGIGNAYSDEVLHRARLSPVTWTSRLTGEEIERLFQATRATLDEWIDRLLEQTGDDFPTKVTAFRDEMAVHGKFGRPCPVCGSRVQRIRYAENETNYCPRCQTGGKLLADRSLSRLLKDDWPKSIEELEGA
jgi:formamidopyrimidine-DNA glycosylase